VARALAGVLIGAALLLPQPPALSARFIGNMAVALTDGSTTLVTDFPYESGAFGYMTFAPSEIRFETATTVALITHAHADHWLPALFQRTTWRVFGPGEVVAGVAAERRIDPPALAAMGIRVEPIETPHAGIGHFSYVVAWHGRRFYFSGDTESLESLAAARGLEAAFVSPWLFDAALAAGQRIDARRIVIYHHQAGQQVPKCTGACQVPRQGEVLRF
jgi:L-ascorbate metabolism protein UlaG (beta-lactamase superfamily)